MDTLWTPEARENLALEDALVAERYQKELLLEENESLRALNLSLTEKVESITGLLKAHFPSLEETL